LVKNGLGHGIAIENPDDQRGPHSAARIAADTHMIGTQYNNRAMEAFAVKLDTVANTIDMLWLERYSNNSRHVRPQVIVNDAAPNEAFITGVEANNQPADIGIRLAKVNTLTGKAILNKVVVAKQNGQYPAEPSIGLVGNGVIAIHSGVSSPVRDRNGNNGHAGGAQVSRTQLFTTDTFDVIGNPLIGAEGRHTFGFGTTYGADAQPAFAVMMGSSTGLGQGTLSIHTLNNGQLVETTAATRYTVAQYADIANLQSRGRRNPNNQGRGFIKGLGQIKNPGYGVDGAFMPEVKSFTASALTGYNDKAAADRGLKDSVHLALVPSEWKPGISTIPGVPTDKPGTNPDGTGSLPTVGTNPGDPNVTPGDGTDFNDTSGCRAAPNRSGDGLWMLVAALGVAVVARRRKDGPR
jgi:hypothetical protein